MTRYPNMNWGGLCRNILLGLAVGPTIAALLIRAYEVVTRTPPLEGMYGLTAFTVPLAHYLVAMPVQQVYLFRADRHDPSRLSGIVPMVLVCATLYAAGQFLLPIWLRARAPHEILLIAVSLVPYCLLAEKRLRGDPA